MNRNPQILGTSARRVRRTVLASLTTALWLSACGLKGPLYLPAPTGTPATSATTAPAAASTATPSTPNTRAQ